MIPPCRWDLKRPGMLIPVFFLFLATASGQFHAGEAVVAATGGSFSTRSGYSAVILNQAGLGRVRRPSVSLHHQQPFITGEVSVSSLIIQLPVSRGALGLNYSGCGIKGLFYSTAWISYGLELHPDVCAGAGIHIYNSGIPGQPFHQQGASCALGIQVRPGEELMLGAHVLHPVGWTSATVRDQMNEMTITTGFSYTFFQTATFYADLHIRSGYHMQTSFGLETGITGKIRLCLGMHHPPLSLACGVEVLHRSLSVQIAYQYILDTGNIPHATLAYIF
jgi:hypothetical protein